MLCYRFIPSNQVVSALNISLAQKSFYWHQDDILYPLQLWRYTPFTLGTSFSEVSQLPSYGLEYWHFSRYCIEVRKSSIVTTCKRDCDNSVRPTRNMKVKKYISLLLSWTFSYVHLHQIQIKACRSTCNWALIGCNGGLKSLHGTMWLLLPR